MPVLTAAKYGKANVKLLKVVRHRDGTHVPTSLAVTVLLEGDISRSYTHADNANIVATDTQKHTVYILARLHPVDPPERFAATVGHHFVSTYPHITAAEVDVTVSAWDRIGIDCESGTQAGRREGDLPVERLSLKEGDSGNGKRNENGDSGRVCDGDGDGGESSRGPQPQPHLHPHPHAFVAGPGYTHSVHARVEVSPTESSSPSSHSSPHHRPLTITLKSGLSNLRLLKTTGSAFHSFHRDEYTRLADTDDRVLATEVSAVWTWKPFRSLAEVRAMAGEEEKEQQGDRGENTPKGEEEEEERQRSKGNKTGTNIEPKPTFSSAFAAVLAITTQTFALERSPSVQNTMYLMATRVLAAVPPVAAVSYTLPNIHNFEIDLTWFRGLDNGHLRAGRGNGGRAGIKEGTREGEGEGEGEGGIVKMQTGMMNGEQGEEEEDVQVVYAPQADPNGLIMCTVARDEVENDVHASEST